MNFNLLIIFMFLSSCQTGNKKTNTSLELKSPGEYTPASFVKITTKGINKYPSLGKNYIYYSSENRHHHKSSQIYRYDTVNKVEKQISFNDGKNILPFFIKDTLFYTSTTDEIKEENYNINFLYKKNNELKTFTHLDFEPKLNFYEIYYSNYNGNHLKRLSKRNGTDIFWYFNRFKKSVYFSTLTKGSLNILVGKIDGHIKSALTRNSLHNIYLKSSPNGKSLIWVELKTPAPTEIVKVKNTSTIVISNARGKNKRFLTKDLSINTHPNWHPNGIHIIFTSNRAESNNFEIFVLNTESLCLQRLTYSNSNELWPSFNKAGDKIIFSSNTHGTYQIYQMSYLPPKTCI